MARDTRPVCRRSRACRSSWCSSCCSALFMYTAPQVFLQPFIYTTFLSTLPPLILLAVGLTFVIGAGEIDLCFPAIIAFSGFVFAVLFKEYDLGWLAGRRRRSPPGCWSASRTACSSPGSASRPSWRRSATQFFWAGMATVLSGGKSYALRGAEDSSVWQWIVGRPFAGSETVWIAQLPMQALWTAIIVVVPLVHPQPPPLRRARAFHRRFERRVARRRHRRRAREDQDLHADGRRSPALAAIMLTLENKNFSAIRARATC